jgi:hypothetical protein
MRFLWSTPYSLYRKGHAATSATRITAAASNTQRFMALRIAAKTGHCKNQIKPLGVKTGRYLAPHGNRLAIPEPFPKAAAYAHRMSVQGQPQTSTHPSERSALTPLRTSSAWRSTSVKRGKRKLCSFANRLCRCHRNSLVQGIGPYPTITSASHNWATDVSSAEMAVARI